MGHGIAQVAATSGYQVCLTDTTEDILATAKARIEKNFRKSVELGKIKDEDMKVALGRVEYTDDFKAVAAPRQRRVIASSSAGLEQGAPPGGNASSSRVSSRSKSPAAILQIPLTRL